MNFLSIDIYCILISFLVGLSVYFLPKNRDPYLKLFPPFLLLTAASETLGRYWGSINKPNLTLYNFFTAFEFCFYIFIISLLIRNTRVRKWMRGSIIFYALAAIINILYFQGKQTFHTVTYSFGCLLVVAFCMYYFLELFRFPKSEKIYQNPAFWISSALLFFYCCGFSLFGLINFWADISQLVVDSFSTIVTILNIFLYSLFTISFLCHRKKNYIS